MIKKLYKDLLNEIQLFQLFFIKFGGTVRILFAARIADRKHRKFRAKEIKKHGCKAYSMNYNVMIMTFPVYRFVSLRKRKLVGLKERFAVASDNEVITLARKLHLLPKRMTANKMNERKSIFYHTFPKMRKTTAIKNYHRYIEREFYKSKKQK